MSPMPPALHRIVFPRAFAPSMPLVADRERPYRQAISLDGRWQFAPEPVPAGWKDGVGIAPALPPASTATWSTTPIKIPSPWNVNAFNRGDGGDFRCYPSYPSTWDTAQMGWLKRSFSVPTAWHDKRLILRFDAVAGDAGVYVNGHEVAHNNANILPYEADVTVVV